MPSIVCIDNNLYRTKVGTEICTLKLFINQPPPPLPPPPPPRHASHVANSIKLFWDFYNCNQFTQLGIMKAQRGEGGWMVEKIMHGMYDKLNGWPMECTEAKNSGKYACMVIN